MAGDLDGIVFDYADDAVFITPAGMLHGKEGVRQGFEKLLGGPPERRVGLSRRDLRGRCPVPRVEGGVREVKADDGIDTFVFRDGLIRVQTVRYTLTPRV